MRLQIRHKTEYRYAAPVTYSIQTLRLSPRAHDGLAVLGWRVEADRRRDLPSYIDGYGNLVHCHSVNRRHDCISLSVEGEVETTDSAGVLRGQTETLPPSFFLRSSKARTSFPISSSTASSSNSPLAAGLPLEPS